MVSPGIAELLDDTAVYRRTARGQQELLVGSRGLAPTERRFLAVVTGFTQLRVLLDMGLASTDIRSVVTRLYRLGLIELDEPV